MTKKTVYKVALGIIVLVAIATVAWYVITKQTRDLNDPETIVKLVSNHYVLPNEEPALVTVTDKSKLETEFLKSAENGDKLLVYKNAKKAFLYRPGIDRLIEVGPVSIAGPN